MLATGSDCLLPRCPSAATTTLCLHLREVNPATAPALEAAHREGDAAAELEAAHCTAALHAAEGVCPQLIGRECLDGGENDVVDAEDRFQHEPYGLEILLEQDDVWPATILLHTLKNAFESTRAVDEILLSIQFRR